MEAARRDRIVSRASEALGLAVAASPPAPMTVRLARELLGAMAVTEQRWDDALALLTALAEDPAMPPADACGFFIAAGDIRAHKLNDAAAGQALYDRANALQPRDSRLVTRLPGAVATPVAHDVTDEMIL
jgi:hypothetical protein